MLWAKPKTRVTWPFLIACTALSPPSCFVHCCVDETGLPLPFAPNELLLLLSGVLVRTGAFSVWIFAPAAAIAMMVGMLAGYGWARAVGQVGLTRLVQRFHAAGPYQRMQRQLQTAGPLHIGLARLLPGLRPWATLGCGAGGIRLRPFLLGAVPALLLWELGWLPLGLVVGLPAERLLGQFERLVVRGGVLLVLGGIAYVGLHRLQRQGLAADARRLVWLPLVLLVGGGAVACCVAGVLAIGRGLVGDDGASWVDGLLIAIVLAAVGGISLARNRWRMARPHAPTT